MNMAEEAFRDLDDGDTAFVALVRGHGSDPASSAEDRAESDAVELTRGIAAHNAVRQLRDPYQRRPETHLTDNARASAAVTRVPPGSGMAAEIDSAPTRSEWEIRRRLTAARANYQQVADRIADLVGQLEGLPVEVAAAELTPDLVFDTIYRLSTQATGPANEATLSGLFQNAPRLLLADAELRQFAEHLATEHGLDHWVMSETEAVRQLTALQARRLVRGVQVLDAIRDLVRDIDGAA